MPFQISGLPARNFEHLFKMRNEELASLHAMRMVVNQKPGFPCRVSLQDADLGEEVLLVHYEHQAADTPFKASHAIYVRPGVRQAEPGIDEVPEMLRSRIMSLRGFDTRNMLISAELSEGWTLEAAIEEMLANSEVAYLQLHFAKPGCYAARVERA
jgi:hypothetical protein